MKIHIRSLSHAAALESPRKIGFFGLTGGRDIRQLILNGVAADVDQSLYQVPADHFSTP
jgi:hypothetical protein